MAAVFVGGAGPSADVAVLGAELVAGQTVVRSSLSVHHCLGLAETD